MTKRSMGLVTKLPDEKFRASPNVRNIRKLMLQEDPELGNA